ncbi:PDZ domain-containing protein [uncultured Microbulbifer sp.]|uniref:PDZ domain-containing protein n=1 Tax=uncultured Microbulbifer sp. TaxID=348147 RepID=UPI0025D92AA7|nr:PDZ domain-containing protein [uncultured Microbulbifer sp.]
MNLPKPVAATLAVTLVLTGAALTRWAQSDDALPAVTLFSAKNTLESRIQQLETTLDETLKIQSQLLELVNELSNRLDPNPGDAETRTVSVAPGDPAVQHDSAGRQQAEEHERRFQRMREHQIRRLTDAGLTPERAQYIVDRQERIQYEQMQLTYQFRFLNDKTSQQARELQQKIHTYSNPRRVFEQELSTREYEQYLSAMGSNTELHIGDLLEAAPAYEAGLRRGDKIIRYNNQRVFHMGDLRTQVYQVEPGKNVAVEIQRQGSSGSEIIYLPSGPLGIRG